MQRGASWQMRTIMGRTCDPHCCDCSRCVQRLVIPNQVADATPSIRGHRRMLAGRRNTYTIPAAARAPAFAPRQPRSPRRAAVPRCAPLPSALSPLMARAVVVARPCDANPVPFNRASSRGRPSRIRLSHASLIEWSSVLLARAGR